MNFERKWYFKWPLSNILLVSVRCSCNHCETLCHVLILDSISAKTWKWISFLANKTFLVMWSICIYLKPNFALCPKYVLGKIFTLKLLKKIHTFLNGRKCTLSEKFEIALASKCLSKRIQGIRGKRISKLMVAIWTNGIQWLI